MMSEEKRKEVYTAILKEELLVAMGCTEPIAIAYAGAIIKQTLKKLPDAVELTISGNIIKNVKSVVVPHTGGRKGILATVAAGICYGKADKELEVLADADEKQLSQIDQFLANTKFRVKESDAKCPFDIQIKAFTERSSAYVRIIGKHTNVVAVHYNDQILFEKPYEDQVLQAARNRELLTVEDIVAFADEADLSEVQEILDRQIAYNSAIAEAGMSGDYGANIGRILLESYGSSIHNRAKAFAAAGSDARMNGCE